MMRMRFAVQFGPKHGRVMVKCDETVVHNDEFTGRLFWGKQVYLGEISLFCAVEG
jgi:hypothetical protein